MFVTNRHTLSFSTLGSVARFSDPIGIPTPNGIIPQSGVGWDLQRPHGLAFRGGELFVVNASNDRVTRFLFDQTGTPLFNGHILDHLGGTRSRWLDFNAAGDLFVSLCCGTSLQMKQWQFDVNGNAIFLREFTTPSVNNHGIAFAPWGEMFVASANDQSVVRFLFDSMGTPVFNGFIVVGGTCIDVAFSSWGELFVSRENMTSVARYTFDGNHNASLNGFVPLPGRAVGMLFSRQRVVTFEELPATTSITNQYSDRGLQVNAVAGAPQILQGAPNEGLLPITGDRLFGPPVGDLAPCQVEFSFVNQTTPGRSAVSYFSCYVVDAEPPGATIVAYDAEGQVAFNQAFLGGNGAQELAAIGAPTITRVVVTLGNGADTSAIDNIYLGEPFSIVSPDLTVESMMIPTSGYINDQATFGFRVINDGDGAATGSWVDRMYLSSDDQPGSDVLVAELNRIGPMAVGTHYDQNAQIALPAAPGLYWVIITTDAANNLSETPSELNNTRVSDNPIAVTYPPAPNLIVSNIELPASGFAGLPVDICFTIKNTGDAAATVPWVDRVFISSDDQIGGDVPAGDIAAPMSLLPNETYEQVASITLPLTPGPYHIVVTTDIGNSIIEYDNEVDNSAISAAPIQAQPFTAWVGGVNNWSGPNNWDPVGVPDNTGTMGFNVYIPGPNSNVSLDIPVTIDAMVVAANAQLHFTFGDMTIATAAGIINHGLIELLAGRRLTAATSTTFAGTAPIRLAGPGAEIASFATTDLITIDGSVAGTGLLTAAFHNNGTVNADSAGQAMFITGTTLATNDGLLVASNDGMLNLERDIGGVGQFRADGGILNFPGLSATLAAGATLTVLGGGQVLVNGMATVKTSGDAVLTCTATGRGCNPPVLNIIGSSTTNVGGNWRFDGPVNVFVAPATTNRLAGNFENLSPSATTFHWESGSIMMDGTLPQTFEAAGRDLGPTNPNGYINNFAMGTLRIEPGRTVDVVNQFQNQAPSGCEALYLDVLSLGNGATLRLHGCNVYHRRLIKGTGVTIDQLGGGQLLRSSPVAPQSGNLPE